MNFRCLVESILNETAVEQNVVEFFALELAKRLIVDSYYATEGDDYADDLTVFNGRKVHDEEYFKYFVDIQQRGADIEKYIHQQQHISKSLSSSFLHKLKQIHTIDYQLHLLELANYGNKQDVVRAELTSQYSILYKQLIPYCVFSLATFAYTRHSDSGYLPNPLFLFTDKGIFVSREISGHAEQGMSKLLDKIQGIVDGNNDRKMYQDVKSNFSYQELESDLREGGFKGISDSWSALLNSLFKASTVLDRSGALTRVLNFAHNRGVFLGSESGSIQAPYTERSSYLYSLLTKEQFDSVNYTNERRAEHELKKMF